MDKLIALRPPLDDLRYAYSDDGYWWENSGMPCVIARLTALLMIGASLAGCAERTSIGRPVVVLEKQPSTANDMQKYYPASASIVTGSLARPIFSVDKCLSIEIGEDKSTALQYILALDVGNPRSFIEGLRPQSLLEHFARRLSAGFILERYARIDRGCLNALRASVSEEGLDEKQKQRAFDAIDSIEKETTRIYELIQDKGDRNKKSSDAPKQGKEPPKIAPAPRSIEDLDARRKLFDEVQKKYNVCLYGDCMPRR